MTALLTQVSIKGSPILGVFGKGIKGSIAFNYGESCGPDCDTNCPHHADSISPHAKDSDSRCYAWKAERRFDRVNLRNKLHRHQLTNRESITTQAHTEYRRIKKRVKSKVKWFRFSAFGSVPKDVPVAFRPLCEELKADKVDIHLPVESYDKVLKYRKVLKGLNIAVRRSCATANHFIRASTRINPLSVVVGNMNQTPKERLVESLKVAKRRSKRTNRKCIVCPAIAVQVLNKGSNNAKCGNCVACALPHVDIVYPVHK